MVKSLGEAQRKVVKFIETDELTKLAQDLVRIPSEPGDEQKVAVFIANKMKQWGFHVTLDEVFPNRPNVYGIVRGKTETPALIYNGHIDVQPPGDGWTDDPYSGLLRTGRIYGRGSADMKGPLASMMVAAKALKNSEVELKGNLMITAVVDEERYGSGTKRLVERKTKADFAVIGEPTVLDIFTAHKGTTDYEITTTGKAAHSSVPHEGINAIYKMAKIVDAIQEFSVELERREKHPLLGFATVNVGTISGGIIPWAVPASCKIAVDRRILPHEDGEKGKKELEEIVERLRREDPGLAAEVRIHGGSPPMETPADHIGVRALREAVISVTGQDPGIKGAPYTTDGGILVNEGNIPAVVFGPGDIRQAHRPDEFIIVDEMITAAKIYALTALKLLS